MDTPNTINYMIAGYCVILGGLLLYTLNLFFRFQKIKKEFALHNDTEHPSD
jgi:hypothetical protein